MSTDLVKRHHMKNWADTLDARSGLPELVKRLIEETSEQLARAEFQTDEGVDLGGFDGTVHARAESRWVPEGYSVWELSVEGSVGTKANRDYEGRDAAPPGWTMPETAYFAVSLRPWLKREQWADERSAEGRWRNVQALGLDNLMSWLSAAPMTELWLAERLGLRPDEFQSGSTWWERRQLSTGGLFDRSIVLAGRDNAADEFCRRIALNDGPIVVEAAAVDEVLEFVAAVGEGTFGASGGQSLLSQMAFVSGRNAWKRLLSESGPWMILVATDPGLIDQLSDTSHAVVIPVTPQGSDVVARRQIHGSGDCVVVPRLDARVVAEALDSPKARSREIDFQLAQRLGALGHRSASALRRRLSVDAAISRPLWAQIDGSSSLSSRQAKTAALLAGEWDSANRGATVPSSDRRILARLAGGNIDYESLEFELNGLATGADPMLVVTNSIWQFVNHSEAWLLLAENLLTADSVDRLLQIAAEVLGEVDPLSGLSDVDRGVAQIRGKVRVHSNQLRRGVARTLALLCIHGGELSAMGGGASAQAKRCVSQLLPRGEKEDAEYAEMQIRLLDGLGDVLPLLAEAAPVEFVQSIDRILRLGPGIAEHLFTDSWDDLNIGGPSSPHTYLLFALETLAWIPQHLADVADVLWRLEILDPGGRLANRPMATFSDVFSAWMSQTSSSHQQRLEVLRGLHGRLIGASANGDQTRALVRLLLELIPRKGSIVTASSRPEICDYQTPPENLDQEAVSAYVAEIVELLLSLIADGIRVNGNAAGLQEVFEFQGGLIKPSLLATSDRDKLWALVEEAVSVVGPEELSTIGLRMAGLARLYSDHSRSTQVLSELETERIARIAEQIADAQPNPEVDTDSNLWLFEEYHPSLGPDFSIHNDIVEYEQELRGRRVDAVKAILQTQGIGRVNQLAAHVQSNKQAVPVEYIGYALAQAHLRLELNPEGDGPSQQTLDLVPAMLAALDIPLEHDSITQDAECQGRVATAYFF